MFVFRVVLEGGPTSPGSLIQVNVKIGGPTTSTDLFSFSFNIKLSNPGIVRNVTWLAGDALTGEQAVVSTLNGDKLVIGVSKLGGTGNGVGAAGATLHYLERTNQALLALLSELRTAFHREPVGILMKVETHNHPTAISPFPGAATGSGGEIRDEGATGRGAHPKAGLCGFSVSNLRIPGFVRPWERPESRPERIASPLAIMIEGPIGAASFNNEFGRPNLAGYFRTFEQEVAGAVRGYHKPIMLAGGVGNISAAHAHKADVPPGHEDEPGWDPLAASLSSKQPALCEAC